VRRVTVAGIGVAGVLATSPGAAQAAPKLALGLGGVERDGRQAVVLSGERFRVRGTLSKWVPGQRVSVRLYRGSRKVAERDLEIRRAGPRGRFSTRLTARGRGRLRVRAVHRATPELGALRSGAARLVAIGARATPGSRGPAVRMLQRGLDELRYAVPRTGVYDAGTSRAVMAYRKVNGMQRTGTASASILRRVVRRQGAYKVRHPGGGHHLEADLSRQVLALVDGKRVVRTYTTSSGARSTPTVRGTFRVYRKTPGTNSLGMVDAVYFIRGYAVHGYKSVPPYGASHGCLRVPIPNARALYDWLRMGDRVFVDG